MVVKVSRLPVEADSTFVHESFNLGGSEGSVINAQVVQLAGDALGAGAIFAHV